MSDQSHKKLLCYDSYLGEQRSFYSVDIDHHPNDQVVLDWASYDSDLEI